MGSLTSLGALWLKMTRLGDSGHVASRRRPDRWTCPRFSNERAPRTKLGKSRNEFALDWRLALGVEPATLLLPPTDDHSRRAPWLNCFSWLVSKNSLSRPLSHRPLSGKEGRDRGTFAAFVPATVPDGTLAIQEFAEFLSRMLSRWDKRDKTGSSVAGGTPAPCC